MRNILLIIHELMMVSIINLKNDGIIFVRLKLECYLNGNFIEENKLQI